MVQLYPWFKFYFPLFQTHYHTLPYPKTKGNKFKPRIKLNHKIYLASFWRKFISDLIQLIGSTRLSSTSDPTDDLNVISVDPNYSLVRL